MTPTRNSYVYVCDLCGHESHRHGLAKDGDLRAGPYVCVECGCSVAQDHPNTGLSRAQHESLMERFVTSEESQ